jgi:hypothetical protein
MHEYTTSYSNVLYKECTECNKRTPHICVRCGYCYSCHFKIENLERQQELKLRKFHPGRTRQREAELHPVKFVTYELAKS